MKYRALNWLLSLISFLWPPSHFRSLSPPPLLSFSHPLLPPPFSLSSQLRENIFNRIAKIDNSTYKMNGTNERKIDKNWCVEVWQCGSVAVYCVCVCFGIIIRLFCGKSNNFKLPPQHNLLWHSHIHHRTSSASANGDIFSHVISSVHSFVFTTPPSPLLPYAYIWKTEYPHRIRRQHIQNTYRYVIMVNDEVMKPKHRSSHSYQIPLIYSLFHIQFSSRQRKNEDRQKKPLPIRFNYPYTIQHWLNMCFRA